MGEIERKQQKQLIKRTMKYASIIVIAAAFALTAEAQRNGGGGGRGGHGGQGGRGGRGGRIPRRFRDSDGALVGCKVKDDSDRPIGGGFMHQEEGEAAYVRTCWKDLDFWDGFDDADFDPRTIDIAVYDSSNVGNCMEATTVHTAIGSFDARDSSKGRYFNPEQADVMLTGDNSVLGHYLSIAADDEIIQCCRLEDLRAEEN